MLKKLSRITYWLQELSASKIVKVFPNETPSLHLHDLTRYYAEVGRLEVDNMFMHQQEIAKEDLELLRSGEGVEVQVVHFERSPQWLFGNPFLFVVRKVRAGLVLFVFY